MTADHPNTGAPPSASPADAASPGAAARLEIRLFGPMEVRLPSGPLPHLRTRKGLWLLALLALRGGREVDRDWLAGTLWPESDTPDARRSLRQCLHDLRQALGNEAGRLQTRSARTLRLDLSGAFVDALAFDAAVARGDAESLRVAVELARGPLLEDGAESWMLEERERREQACIEALRALAASASAAKEYEAAAECLRRAIRTDPLREDLQRALMQALADGGQPAAALLVYREYRDLLLGEMASEPAEETTALFRRIREQVRFRPNSPTPLAEPQEAAIAAPLLPRPLTGLVGRETAVRELAERLAQSRLVTLTGTGGIGKTRLALAVAEDLAPQLDAGARFVGLASLSEPGRVPDAVRAALEIQDGDGRHESTELLARHLAGHRLLLVLDNCEHLAGACAELVRTLLPICPEVRLLATSRQPLGVPGEVIWRVPPLALVPAEGNGPGAEGPASCAAVRLFAERAGAAEASFRLTPERAAVILGICRRLEGIPLAIELAAARVRALPVEQIAGRLDEGFGLLKSPDQAAPPRHQTLAATFDWSWELLSPAEQALLCRLSVFAGGWTLEAAEGVCGGAGVWGCGGAGVGEDGPTGGPAVVDGSGLPHSHTSTPPYDVLDLLAGLVEKSLVQYVPDGSGPAPSARYAMLETVRQYAEQRLRESGAEADARRRHGAFFAEWAVGVWPILWTAELATGFRRLEADHDNLRASLSWCRSSGEVEREFRIVHALGRFWDTYGHLREGRAQVESAIERIHDGLSPELRANVLVTAGWMAYEMADYPAARTRYEETLALARAGDRATFTANVVRFLGFVAVQEGNLAEARALYDEALAVYRELKPDGDWGVLLHSLGELAMEQGDSDAARSYLEESLAYCERKNDVQLTGITLLLLGHLELRLGHPAEASGHCAAALRIFREHAVVTCIPGAIEFMGAVAAAEARWARAAMLMGAAEALREKCGVGASAGIVFDAGEAPRRVRCALGDVAYEAAFAEGGRMDLEEAVAAALAPAVA